VPIYEYRCRNGHSFEAFQNMSDDPLASCEVCDAPVERVLHPVAVHFKGSGFYSTDYKGKGEAPASNEGDSSSDGKADSKSESKSESKSDSKSDSSKSSNQGGSAAKAGSSSD